MAWYRTGAIAVTNGSATVTGTGTAFNNNVQPGHAINLPDGRVYEVLEVVSNTVITLGSNYLGSTASGQTYSIQPNQGFAQSAFSKLSDLLAQFANYVTTALAGKFGDGTVGAPGVSFAAEQATGLYRKAPGELGIAVGGAEVGSMTNALVRILRPQTVVRAVTDFSDSIFILNSATSSGAWARIGFQAGTKYGYAAMSDGGDILLANTFAGAVVISTNNAEALRIASGGAVSIASATTASAANLFQSSSGTAILRSTSSRRYKHRIEDIEPQYADKVLEFRSRWYQSNAEPDNPEHGFWGFVAEEVAEIDPRLVHFAYLDSDYDQVEVEPARDAVFDDVAVEIAPATLTSPARYQIQRVQVAPARPPRYERRLKEGAEKVPDGVQYERVCVLLLDVVKREKTARLSLETRFAQLEARVAEMEAGNA